LKIMKKTLIALFICLISMPVMAGDDCEVCGPQITGSPLVSNFSFQALGQATNYIKYSNDKKSFPTTLPNDPRKIFNKNSPSWLEAVGKLEVPHRSKDEVAACSISLVTNRLGNASNIAVTAGHCMEFWKFPGQSAKKPAKVTFKKSNGVTVVLYVEEVLSMQPREGDYAILKLSEKIPTTTIKPLMIADRGYRDEDGLGYLEFDEFNGGPGHKKAYGTIAGYSTDSSPKYGNKGKNLTYHEDCHLNGGSSYRKTSKCWSYPGASGGAAVVTVDQVEYNDNIGVEHLYVGAVQGELKDVSKKNTLLTPLEFFREPLESAFDKFMP
jgi:hypothetical protein